MQRARELLESTNLAERAQGVDALAGMRGREATDALVGILHESSWLLRERAVRALAEREDVLEPTLQALKAGNWYTRASGCDVLGRGGDARALGALLTQLLDRNVSVQKSAADAIRRLTETHGVEPLAREIEGMATAPRRAAMARLAHQCPELTPTLFAALPPLAASSGDEDPTEEVAALRRFRAWISSHVADKERE
jgi:HEAT repeat protein